MEEKKFSEKDLCDKAIKAVDGTECRVFPEYENWDLVITRGKIILGLQAKLTLNVKAIAQTIESSGAHFKGILVYDYKLKLNDPYITILNKLKIILFSYYPKPNEIRLLNTRFSYRRFVDLNWLLPWRHKNIVPLTIPDFNYITDAGVPSPRKVSTNNVNLVRLELFALEQPDRCLTLAQIRSFGFYRVPRQYFFYDWEKRLWRLDDRFSPSKDYPHIAAGILESKKNAELLQNGILGDTGNKPD